MPNLPRSKALHRVRIETWLSPPQVAFLDRVAEVQYISRADVLRRIVDEAIERNKQRREGGTTPAGLPTRNERERP